MTEEAISLALAYAKRVAFNMSGDPEMESIAGSAAWRAVRTYRVEKGPLKRWIARCVKTQVWCYWRAMKLRRTDQVEPEELEEAIAPAAEEPLGICYFDYKMLYEHYIDRLPLDVMARKYDTNKRGVRRMLDTAIERLVASRS